MNYFELFDIPVSLQPNRQLIKQKFYELSRKYHPDFYTQENDAEQAEALEKSSLVNKAYQTFQNDDETIKYVLQLKGLLEEEEKYALPPDFLMEVMELNEQLMEAKMEQDDAALSRIQSSIAALQEEIYKPVREIVSDYEDGVTADEKLLQVKEYYFKKKYLNRILAAL
jgi:molecular chaperone HscB